MKLLISLRFMFQNTILILLIFKTPTTSGAPRIARKNEHKDFQTTIKSSCILLLFILLQFLINFVDYNTMKL